ncbi:MAG: hypothetical protein J1G30_08185 [Spirochaetales bacterium]|nr:hypothetical protein [Spirochaetales bacterium]
MIKKILFPVAALIFALPLIAQPISPKHNNPPCRIPENDLDLRFLNLSEEQKVQIGKITDEYKKKIDLIIVDLNRNKLDFDEIMINDDYDFNKLKEMIENRKKLESDILINFLERDLKVKDLLTKEQWNVFKKNFPKGVNFFNKKDEINRKNKIPPKNPKSNRNNRPNEKKEVKN